MRRVDRAREPEVAPGPQFFDSQSCTTTLA